MGVDLYCRSDRERSLSIGEPQPVSSSAKLMGTKVRNPDHGGVYARGLDGHGRGEVWDESWLGRTDGLDPAGSPDHLSQLYVPPLRALHHQLKGLRRSYVILHRLDPTPNLYPSPNIPPPPTLHRPTTSQPHQRYTRTSSEPIPVPPSCERAGSGRGDGPGWMGFVGEDQGVAG